MAFHILRGKIKRRNHILRGKIKRRNHILRGNLQNVVYHPTILSPTTQRIRVSAKIHFFRVLGR